MAGKILITGGTGFIGKATRRFLAEREIPVRTATRNLRDNSQAGVDEIVKVGTINSKTDWASALDGIDSVIHLAARAHVLREDSPTPLASFRAVNTDGTLNLARQAAKAGVRRFLYVSSIGVNGSITKRRPFCETDPVNPGSPYAVSKWEAEQGLTELHEKGRIEVTIVRPPLVYGPGAPGNIERLIKLIKKGVPLPVGKVKNQRSLIGVNNLASLLVACIHDSRAAGQTFLAADGQDLSTPELVRLLAQGLNRPARLWNVPVPALRIGAIMSGKIETYNSLCESLQIDATKATKLLGWQPSHDVHVGIQKTADQ